MTELPAVDAFGTPITLGCSVVFERNGFMRKGVVSKVNEKKVTITLEKYPNKTQKFHRDVVVFPDIADYILQKLSEA